jgi:histidyl-tRNA synthetase
MKRGRYREFYQCDFDIVGTGAVMAQDAEVLKIVAEILTRLEFNFIIKINHRKLLDSILDVAGIPAEKFRTVASSIDKLDKEPWEKVRHELVEDKGISNESADKVGEYVKLNGSPEEVLAKLNDMEMIASHKVAKLVLQELAKLSTLTQCLGIQQVLSLDMSLARGLDYYTGLVYEAVVVDGSVGSIAGGGRYDELISRLNNSNQPTPAVGVSLGVERLFTVIEERVKAVKAAKAAKVSKSPQEEIENLPETGNIQALVRSREKCVLVAQAGSSDRFNLLVERFKICNLLWAQGVKAETSYKEKSDPKGQAGYASQEGIRWIVWVGDSELVEGKVKVKDLNSHSEEVILVSDVAAYVLSH